MALALQVVSSHALGALISFLVITYMLVVLGELVPKSLALHRGERIALAVAGPAAGGGCCVRTVLWHYPGSRPLAAP